jgi:hypothetical protein
LLLVRKEREKGVAGRLAGSKERGQTKRIGSKERERERERESAREREREQGIGVGIKQKKG